jgi:hypothetical protein
MARLEIVDVRVRRDAACALDDGVQLLSKALDTRLLEHTRYDEIAVFVIKSGVTIGDHQNAPWTGPWPGSPGLTSRLAPARWRGQTTAR